MEINFFDVTSGIDYFGTLNEEEIQEELKRKLQGIRFEVEFQKDEEDTEDVVVMLVTIKNVRSTDEQKAKRTVRNVLKESLDGDYFFNRVYDVQKVQ